MRSQTTGPSRREVLNSGVKLAGAIVVGAAAMSRPASAVKFGTLECGQTVSDVVGMAEPVIYTFKRKGSRTLILEIENLPSFFDPTLSVEIQDPDGVSLARTTIPDTETATLRADLARPGDYTVEVLVDSFTEYDITVACEKNKR